MSYKKEDAERLLSEINTNIVACDNKAAVLMAFLAIFIGLTTKVFDVFGIIDLKLHDSGIQIFIGAIFIILAILYFVSVFGSILSLGSVLFARTRTMIKYKKTNKFNENSPLYFGAIAKFSKEDFVGKTQEFTEESLLNELNEQCMVVSKIADIKFKSFNTALIFAIVFSIITIILLAIV